jgi:hypothetical protein
MVGQLIIEKTEIKDVENQTTNMGGGTTTYISTF